MSSRLGHFYASLLVFICLGINIAFFPEVREPFLGGDDPLASVKAALSDLNIKARFVEICPKTQFNTDSEASVPTPQASPTDPVKSAEPTKKPAAVSIKIEPVKTAVPKTKTAQNESLPDPFLLPSSQPKEPAPPADLIAVEQKQFERTKPTDPQKESGLNRQTAASVPIPQSAAARPIIADQFKPIVTPSKSIESTKPSPDVVWDTIDTITERPLRYD
jgi:hypothetical protein